MSKSRPILFSAPMIRALLDGRKTQTRRVVKPTPDWEWPMPCPSETPEGWQGPLDYSLWSHEGDASDCARRCPYGAPGDTLWVRETYRLDGLPIYRASVLDGYEDEMRRDGLRWKPSIFMPRWASRITLRVTSVRVERLNEISEADAEAEGCERPELPTLDCGPHLMRAIYSGVWEYINGPGTFDARWVWVVSFERVK